MCGIFAMLSDKRKDVQGWLKQTSIKGRDSWGAYIRTATDLEDGRIFCNPNHGFENKDIPEKVDTILFNARAIPTTEVSAGRTENDTQPYDEGGWVIVHNGTIANDKELIAKYNLNPPTGVDSWVIAGLAHHFEHESGPRDINDEFDVFLRTVHELSGSYAIVAKSPSFDHDDPTFFYATDYRPIYLSEWGPEGDRTIIVSSIKINKFSRLIEPYSCGIIDLRGLHKRAELYDIPQHDKAKTLIVHSGGLDSTVAAAMLKARGHEITLLHFDYGCRATANETKAVRDIAAYMNVDAQIIPLTVFKDVIKASRLLDDSAEIADTVAGAETAHEWVPARNMILTSIVLGIAEARGFDHIALGINLEESGGGYTDNVIDLYEGLNNLMQWIVGRGKKLSILTPVGNMMKHDIVRTGLEVNAPMHLTYSCYNASTDHKHCGKCGPCFMRKTAFEMNNAVDPVFKCEG